MSTKKKLLLGSAGAATAGGGGLDVDNVFSTYTYRGNGLSHVIGNSIALGNDGDGGSAEFTNPNTLIVPNDTSLQLGSGDFTIEAFLYPYENNSFVISGFGYDTNNRFDFGWQSNLYPRAFIRESGAASSTTNNSSYPISNYVGQWVHVAVTRNSNTVRLFIDGTQVGSFSFTGSMPSPGDGGVGIGSRWYHTRTSLTNSGTGHISNFRIVKGTALYTSNFTAPTSALTAVSGTSLLTLQGDTPLSDNSGNSHSISQSIYNIYDEVTPSVFGPFTASESGSGGLVTIKSRTAANGMCFYDTERGANIRLRAHSTGGNSTRTDAVSSFNSNGFSLGAGSNENPDAVDQVSWTFRKAEKFFDVLTYTGNGVSGRTVSHNLGSVPGCIIVKRTDAIDNWFVYHRGLNVDSDNAPETDVIMLNSTNAAFDNPLWNDYAPTSSDFQISNNAGVNASGGTYVAYLFAHNDGDGGFGPDSDQDIIKCGSYAGQNSGGTDIDVNLGFEPQWLLLKPNASASWYILDNMRGIATGGNSERLFPNNSNAETSTTGVALTPTGFTVTAGSELAYASGYDILYMAIRRGPLAEPTSATDVFAIDDEQFTGGDAHAFYSGFTPDMLLEKQPSTTGSWPIATRLQGNKYLVTDGTSAETTGTSIIWDHMHGAFDPFSGTAYQAWMWKRAPGYFDVVAVKGKTTSGNAEGTMSHNLGAVPEMIWGKCRNVGRDWQVYHKDLGASKFLMLQSSAAAGTNSNYWGTTPTDSVFYAGSEMRNNDNNIFYLFATVAGVSKVGSYTGDGTNSKTIDCGFSSGARFVLIKRTSGTGSWITYDTERGITASDDPFLYLDTNASENTISSFDIDPHSSGFTLGGSGSYINASGQSYIFYAIA